VRPELVCADALPGGTDPTYLTYQTHLTYPIYQTNLTYPTHAT